MNDTGSEKKSPSVLFGNATLGKITNNISIGYQKFILNNQIGLTASINVRLFPCIFIHS